MYVLADELSGVRETPPTGATDPARILSILDPWTQGLWAQYSARWGEGWFFPIVKDGDLVGMAEIWEMSGCVEIREIDLNSPDLLSEVLGAVDRMMEFYRSRGYEIVRLVRAFNKEVPALETVKPFLDAGYARLGDFLAKGEIVPREFDKSQLLAYVFRCQGLDPDRPFDTAEAAATALLGLRSDFAARLRVREFTPLERLHRRGALSAGRGKSRRVQRGGPRELPAVRVQHGGDPEASAGARAGGPTREGVLRSRGAHGVLDVEGRDRGNRRHVLPADLRAVPARQPRDLPPQRNRAAVADGRARLRDLRRYGDGRGVHRETEEGLPLDREVRGGRRRAKGPRAVRGRERARGGRAR